MGHDLCPLTLGTRCERPDGMSQEGRRAKKNGAAYMGRPLMLGAGCRRSLVGRVVT